MALDPVVNFFRSTIATLPVASGGTVIVLQTGDGAKLPNPAVDGAFNLTIYNADDPFVTPEIVRVTSISGDSLTVTRAQEGTTATNKTSGSTWNVELTPTAKTIQDIDAKKLDVAGGTMTGDLTIPDKIIHAGDTNTAIRFPANDTVAIETAGVQALRVDGSQRVLINTTVPGNARLKVASDSNKPSIQSDDISYKYTKSSSLPAAANKIRIANTTMPTGRASMMFSCKLVWTQNNTNLITRKGYTYFTFNVLVNSVGTCEIQGFSTISEINFTVASNYTFTNLGSGSWQLDINNPITAGTGSVEYGIQLEAIDASNSSNNKFNSLLTISTV